MSACINQSCKCDIHKSRDSEERHHSQEIDSPSHRDRQRLYENVRTVIIAGLSLSMALGFNNLLTSVIEDNPESKSPRSKAFYFFSMFTCTMALTILIDADLKK